MPSTGKKVANFLIQVFIQRQQFKASLLTLYRQLFKTLNYALHDRYTHFPQIPQASLLRISPLEYPNSRGKVNQIIRVSTKMQKIG